MYFFLKPSDTDRKPRRKKIEYGLTVSYINKTNKQNISM